MAGAMMLTLVEAAGVLKWTRVIGCRQASLAPTLPLILSPHHSEICLPLFLVVLTLCVLQCIQQYNTKPSGRPWTPLEEASYV
ncbi:hypothetical protein BKA82DRAFT_512010 [Pisolithus tinctorius]|uniref:Uncharacterized protein n=1 Tax=Pisolithus tinctorius Marx 270 TaxID=870435 RepID=A0A0C3PCR6_PISTI|nr:hypothetical protein BKA82DRAFT_512010 [Pisolithus tinctorius]KIO05544.1 hypothetical protein M404DRAFT_512010 [Pisolithus tinctorius Marx 270]